MIPVNQPYISKSDAIAVYKAVKSGWVSSSGHQINLFENSALVSKINMLYMFLNSEIALSLILLSA